MSIDVASVRSDTPGCENVLHFNNAGASLPPALVLERVKAHLDLEAAIGGYEAADRTADEYERIYASIARMLGCRLEEIALVESATRAWDAAFYAFAERLQPGDRILTAANEYLSNFLAFYQTARRRGVEIVVVPSQENGEISLSALETAIERQGRRAKLIALTHVPTNGGVVQPAAAVGRIARRNGIPFLLDACQSAGQMPLPVEELGCDMLSATGRKYLRAPRGTGFLYVRQALLEQLEPAILDMRSAELTAPGQYRLRGDARRFETWESSVACRLGLGVAVDYAMAIGMDKIEARVVMLAEKLRQQLAEISGITLREMRVDGPGGNENRSPALCGIVPFTHSQHTPQAIFERLRDQHINVRVTHIGLTENQTHRCEPTELVRASVHYYNSEEEIARFAEAVREL